ncbi:MAG: hypothetical protein PHT58_06860 [Eubacteriales bacterium]|nr:hypothetical protein [Eubacteriales bacterium]
MRKFLAIILAACLVLSIVACKSKDEQLEQDQTQEQSLEPTQEPTQSDLDVMTAADPSASPSTAQPSIASKPVAFSGLTIYIPQEWTASELSGTFTAISNEYYIDSGTIISMRNNIQVPTVTAESGLTQEQVNSILSGLIADADIQVTKSDANATIAGYPAIRALAETDNDGVRMYMLLYVTVSPDINNFVLAAGSLDYTDIASFDTLFGYTQVS